MERPERVIGIDPGGADGIVACLDWECGAGRWPPWLPTHVTPWMSSEELSSWSSGPDLLRHFETEHWIACEKVTLYQPGDENLVETCEQVGAFRITAERAGSPFARIPRQTIVAWLLGGKAKGSTDGAVDRALLAAYGGREKAVGGKRCKACGGKGRRGRGVPRHECDFEYVGYVMEKDRYYRPCSACQAEGSSPRGPLYPLWKPKSLPHGRSALAVALYAYNNPEVWR